jgi:tryptophan 2,3-dioxygenase
VGTGMTIGALIAPIAPIAPIALSNTKNTDIIFFVSHSLMEMWFKEMNSNAHLSQTLYAEGKNKHITYK